MLRKPGGCKISRSFQSKSADSHRVERVMSGSSSTAFSAMAFVFWLSLCSGSIGQESRDETLKKLLERYPAADANKDGKLSVEEARAYRAKLTGKSAAE